VAKKTYKINLMKLSDLLLTHYAVGIDMSNPFSSSPVSKDPIYKDGSEFQVLASAITTLLNNGQYKPFPYSDLEVNGSLELVYPVSTGDRKVRFGATHYDVDDSAFVIDTSRGTSQSLICLDYDKYLGHGLSKNEKDDLLFLLNIIRTGRSPLLEISLLKDQIAAGGDKLVEVGIEGVQKRFSYRSNTFPELVAAYTNQVARIAALIGDNSPLSKSPTTQIASGSAEKISPLIVILLDYLGASGFKTGGTVSLGGIDIDPAVYTKWRSDVLDPISPENLVRNISSGQPLACMIYIFQYIAGHPGIVNKVIETGAVSCEVSGQDSPKEVPTMVQARNDQLLQVVRESLSSPANLDEYGINKSLQMSGQVISLIINSLKASSSVLIFKNSMEGTSRSDQYNNFFEDLEESLKNGSASGSVSPELFDDILKTYQSTNIGLVPGNSIFTTDPSVGTTRVGLGLIDQSARDLGAASFEMVRFEEEMYRNTDYSITSSQMGLLRKRDLSVTRVSSLSHATWSKQSTVNSFKKSYEISNPFGVLRATNSGYFYTAEVDGKDTGALHPYARRNVVEEYDSWNIEMSINNAIKMSDEFDSRSRGKWYKLDFEVVRSTRTALERALSRIEAGTR
jgi:hypothetical protein